MSDWMACYEVPRTCSWRKGSNGEIVIARPDGNVELMSSDEFDAKYVLRRPAPGELRDDLRKCEAEIERLRARVEVLELIRKYMGQGVSWDRAEERAIDEIAERKARAALEAKP